VQYRTNLLLGVNPRIKPYVKLRQLRNIRRDPPRLVARQQLGCGAPPRLVLEIDMASFCPALSITIKHASNSSRDQGGGKRRTRGRTWSGKRQDGRLSFPKIPSGQIHALRQNQHIIRCDAYDRPSVHDLCCAANLFRSRRQLSQVGKAVSVAPWRPRHSGLVRHKNRPRTSVFQNIACRAA
jgi:hypothetical protein